MLMSCMAMPRRHPRPRALGARRPLVLQRYAWSDPAGSWQTCAVPWGGIVLRGEVRLAQAHADPLLLHPGDGYAVPTGHEVRLVSGGPEVVEMRWYADPEAVAACWARIRAAGGPDLARVRAARLRPGSLVEAEAWCARLDCGGCAPWLAEGFWWAMAAGEAAGLRAPTRAPPRWLATAIAGIESGHGLRDGVPGLARLAGRSVAHVTRTVRACWGERGEDLVARLRLRHAERLLADTDLPLATIAAQVGWPSRAWLHARFTAAHGGTTPGAWRRARKQG